MTKYTYDIESEHICPRCGVAVDREVSWCYNCGFKPHSLHNNAEGNALPSPW